MIDNKDCVQLCSYLCNVCLALKTATQGKDADDLSESERMGLKDLERCVDYIPTALSVDYRKPPQVYMRDRADSQEGDKHTMYRI